MSPISIRAISNKAEEKKMNADNLIEKADVS